MKEKRPSVGGKVLGRPKAMAHVRELSPKTHLLPKELTAAPFLPPTWVFHMMAPSSTQCVGLPILSSCHGHAPMRHPSCPPASFLRHLHSLPGTYLGSTILHQYQHLIWPYHAHPITVITTPVPSHLPWHNHSQPSTITPPRVPSHLL